MWALTEHLVSTRGYHAVVLVPDPLAPEFRQTSGGMAYDTGHKECSGGSVTLMPYPSVSFEEYQPHGGGPINELTGVLTFHLANCASLLLNRTAMDSLSKMNFSGILGVATDPCSTFLADKLKIRRRAAYDDGSATSLLWGVVLGYGHPTSHVAAYGTGLGGGAMTVSQRIHNVLQYHRLQLWRRRVYDPRVSAFRQRHRLQAPLLVVSPAAAGAPPSRPASKRPEAGAGEGGAGVGPGGRMPCHLRGQVIITGADWGLIEPQPLPPAVKLVGPLRARPGPPAPRPPPPPPPPSPPAPRAPSPQAEEQHQEQQQEEGKVQEEVDMQQGQGAGGGAARGTAGGPGVEAAGAGGGGGVVPQQQTETRAVAGGQPSGEQQSEDQGPLPPALQPEELAAFVASAKRGLSIIYFPPDYRLPLRALLALAEAVIDLRLHIVWRAAEAEIARVRQLYLPLKHADHILMLPEVPLPDLLAQPQVVSIVSAGSVQAIYAAIYAAKPVMAVPLNPSQEDLVARVAALGAGQRLSRAELEGGASSYKVSVAMERMRNIYSFTQSIQLLSTQLRATLGSASSLEQAAAWVDYTLALDEAGRQYLTPRSTLPLAAAGTPFAGGGAAGTGAPIAAGGGGCMTTMESVNAMAYGILAAAGIGAVGLVALIVHVCTRVPAPPAARLRKAGAAAGQSHVESRSRTERGKVQTSSKSKDE